MHVQMNLHYKRMMNKTVVESSTVCKCKNTSLRSENDIQNAKVKMTLTCQKQVQMKLHYKRMMNKTVLESPTACKRNCNQYFTSENIIQNANVKMTFTYQTPSVKRTCK